MVPFTVRRKLQWIRCWTFSLEFWQSNVFIALSAENIVAENCRTPCINTVICVLYISMPMRPTLTLTLDIHTYSDRIYFSLSVNLVSSPFSTLSSTHFWMRVFHFLFSFPIAYFRFHSRMVLFVWKGRKGVVTRQLAKPICNLFI